jgi:hypothetical protein
LWHACSQIIIINFISNNSLLHHSLRKSKLTLILGCTYACFPLFS